MLNPPLLDGVESSFVQTERLRTHLISEIMGRKTAEVKLRKLEEKYRGLLEESRRREADANGRVQELEKQVAQLSSMRDDTKGARVNIKPSPQNSQRSSSTSGPSTGRIGVTISSFVPRPDDSLFKKIDKSVGLLILLILLVVCLFMLTGGIISALK